MVGCWAFGCSNRSENGFRMHRFPREPARRAMWGQMVRRTDHPSNSSHLCQEHFEADQYEIPREDGKMKLKNCAVPTIFVHRSPPSKKRRMLQRTVSITHVPPPVNDHTYVTSTPFTKDYSATADIVDPIPCTSSQFPIDTVDEPCRTDVCRSEEVVDKELVATLKKRIANLSSANRKLRKRLSNATTERRTYVAQVHKLFSSDQLSALGRCSTRGMKWHSDTIRCALQLRFSCGTTGYSTILSHGYPLPSGRTLRWRMQSIPFTSGILKSIFDYMKVKVSHLQPLERNCCLILDEMSITPALEFDKANDSIVGDVTLPGHSGRATHILVFMLAGITSRWKQTVAYYYTGNSVRGETFKPIIINLLQLASSIGLHVMAVTSDMGAANRAMWNSFGVNCSRDFSVVDKIPHPILSDRYLYFLADVPHLIKNLKAAFVRNQVIQLSSQTMADNNLQHAFVDVKPLQDVVQYREGKDLLLAPKLSISTLQPSHYDKMKVGSALNFFSTSVAAGLRYLARERTDKQPEYEATMWFVQQCNRWFDLMSSRNPVMALSKNKEGNNDTALQFLKSFIDLFQTLNLGPGVWKPVQTGVILSTTSILEIAEELLNNGHGFLLTSRFTQDCLENLFSCIRFINPIPTPLEVRVASKTITVAQYLVPSSSTSYELDDREFLAEFLDTTINVPEDEQPIAALEDSSKTVLISLKMNSVHCIMLQDIAYTL